MSILPSSIGIGGNCLANVLIQRLGADFPTRFPPDADPACVVGEMDNQSFDIWSCWAAIMRWSKC